MKRENRIFRHFPVVLVLASLVVFSACSGMRNIEFTKMPFEQAGPSKTTIDLRNFAIEIKPKNPSKTIFPNSEEILRQRFAEHLYTKGIRWAATGPSDYSLEGNLTVRETNTVNGWLAGVIVVPLFTWGLGTPLGLLLPCVTYYHSADATLVLVDTKNNKEVYRATVAEGPVKTWHMVYQLGTSPESRRNVLISDMADEVMEKAAKNLSAFIQSGATATERK
jgi:hypothetical protein